MLLTTALALANAPINPAAHELFDRDPVLKEWALRVHDGNHDGWLTVYESNEAANDFRTIADADHDGRVTVREYEAAVAFLRARY